MYLSFLIWIFKKALNLTLRFIPRQEDHDFSKILENCVTLSEFTEDVFLDCHGILSNNRTQQLFLVCYAFVWHVYRLVNNCTCMYFRIR